MPQPVAVRRIADPLLKAYRDAWRTIIAEQNKIQALLLDEKPDTNLAVRLRARRARLRQIQASIEDALKGLDTTAEQWAAKQIPGIYAFGQADAAEAIGKIQGNTVGYSFTQADSKAVEQMATGIYHDLLAATDGVRKSTKALIRTVAKNQSLNAAITGGTPKQVARQVTKILAEKGISAVTYSNGARVGMADYAEMAIRTSSAKAYSQGSINTAASLDVTVWEVFDGPDCGLTYHDDPTLADGLIMDQLACETYIISHPNCVRAFGPRPDLAKADATWSTDDLSAAQQTQTDKLSRLATSRAMISDNNPKPGNAHQAIVEARRASIQQRSDRSRG